MGSDPRHRKDNRKSRSGRAAGTTPDPDTSEYPNLKFLRQILVSDGDLLPPEAHDALQKAIRLIENIDFDGYGAVCTDCGGDTVIGLSTPLAPVVCPVCVFWHDRIMGDARAKASAVPNFYTLRVGGEHYTIRGMSSDDEPGQVMTVRQFDGLVIVTKRLIAQGTVPMRYRQVLPDNAYITEGNPQNLPMGVHRP